MKKNIIYIFLSFTLFLHFSKFSFSQTGWYQQNLNLTYDLYSVCFIDVNTGFVFGDNGTAYKTVNGGSNWFQLFIYLNYGINYCSYFINGNTGYIAGAQSISGPALIYKTTNGGINWFAQTPNSIDPIYSIFIVHQSNGSLGFAVGGNGSMIKTINGGTNWYLLTSGTFVNLFSVYFTDTNTGYTCGGGRAFMKTTNAGIDWFALDFSPLSDVLYSVEFVNNTTGYVSGGLGYLYKTTNSGLNWTYQNTNHHYLRALDFADINTGYVVGDTGCILKTNNAGVNWYPQSSGTTKRLRSVFFVNPNTGWAVGDSGTILKTTNGGGPIGIKPISTNVPDRFNLYQNYPNPFNPSTKIKFEIAMSPLSRGVDAVGQPARLQAGGVLVRLVIYDILGRVVTTLVNERLQPGIYEVEFPAPSGDGSNYTSGVYFYKLQTDNFAKTKKMILIK
jgi:photosystem II stability/assembly factor-like uncharacterized protein